MNVSQENDIIFRLNIDEVFNFFPGIYMNFVKGAVPVSKVQHHLVQTPHLN